MLCRRRGYAHYYKRGFNLSISDFTEAIRLDSKNPEAFRSRGVMYYRKNDYERAIFDFTEALWLDPNDTQSLEFRNRAYADRAARR